MGFQLILFFKGKKPTTWSKLFFKVPRSITVFLVRLLHIFENSAALTILTHFMRPNIPVQIIFINWWRLSNVTLWLVFWLFGDHSSGLVHRRGRMGNHYPMLWFCAVRNHMCVGSHRGGPDGLDFPIWSTFLATLCLSEQMKKVLEWKDE